MSTFVIADLHLSLNEDCNKPMDVFGRRWTGYVEKLESRWRTLVKEDDTVILPGDISWALTLEDARADLTFIDRLPGRKYIGKGNHDFWWSSMSKLCAAKDAWGLSSLNFLYNNAIETEEYVLAGTRGWFLDERQQVTVGSVDFDKIVNREVIRLKLSLDHAASLQRECMARDGYKPPISVFLHFPPVWLDFVCRPFVNTLHEYGDPDCYFGHIHGMYNTPRSFDFEGIKMRLIASDAMDFTLYRLPDALT